MIILALPRLVPPAFNVLVPPTVMVFPVARLELDRAIRYKIGVSYSSKIAVKMMGTKDSVVELLLLLLLLLLDFLLLFLSTFFARFSINPAVLLYGTKNVELMQ